jgi:hypothetical protein
MYFSAISNSLISTLYYTHIISIIPRGPNPLTALPWQLLYQHIFIILSCEAQVPLTGSDCPKLSTVACYKDDFFKQSTEKITSDFVPRGRRGNSV